MRNIQSSGRKQVLVDRLTEAAGPNAVLLDAPEVVEQPKQQPLAEYDGEEEVEEQQQEQVEEVDDLDEEEEQALSGLTSTDPRAEDANDLSIYK